MQRLFQKMWINKQHNFSRNKLFSSELLSVYLLAQINTQKINFSVKNLFSKCEHIHIKLRIYSHLSNKSWTENFIFCVVNIIGFTTESCKFFFKPNLSYILHQLTHDIDSIQSPLQKSIFGMFERARTFSTGIIGR